MNTSQQKWMTLALFGLANAAITSASILLLGHLNALVICWITSFLGTLLGFWLTRRMGIEDTMGADGGLVVSMTAGFVFTHLYMEQICHAPFFDRSAEANALASLILAPMAAALAALMVAAFNQSYPGRLGYWFKPSRVASKRYLEQRIKEAERRESIAKYQWENSRQATANLRQRLAEFDDRTNQAMYR